jgi:two-component system, OmpR family, phosphate regulon sensor histidine kinase PhoR
MVKTLKETSVNYKPEKIHILVVDDETGIREGAERILTRMDYIVSTASCGEEGLEIINREEISFVLLDLKMPGIDGMEVLRRIREMNSDIMVIVITGFATVETAIEAMKQGAYDFIPKPFEPDQLRMIVNRATEKLRLTWEAEALQREREQTLEDLGTEKSRIHTILESLPNGVLVTNAEGRIALANPSFQSQLGLDPEKDPVGASIEEYIVDKTLCALIMDISQGRHIDFEDIPEYEFSPDKDKYLMAHAKPIIGNRSQCLGAVVTLMDVSTMKALDQLKSEFVAKVSHELRSPLSTIHEQLAMVLKESHDTARMDQHLIARAKEKTKGLISFIGDLLDLSRIEAGNVGQEPKSTQVETLLEGIVDFLETLATGKNQTLVLETVENSLPAIMADPMALESIFGNLISNAINYTQEGGTISVSIAAAGENIRVAVADNGFGIEAKYVDKIFDQFYRVKTESTRYITGTGLGLPIVKGLLDSMGGSIFVESQPNVGTKFTVLLPANKLQTG